MSVSILHYYQPLGCFIFGIIDAWPQSDITSCLLVNLLCLAMPFLMLFLFGISLYQPFNPLFPMPYYMTARNSSGVYIIYNFGSGTL